MSDQHQSTIRIGWRWWARTLAPMPASAGAIAVSLAGYHIAGVLLAVMVCAWTLLRLARLRRHV